MGYDLHITRKDNPFDKDKDKDITLEEWVEYLRTDDQMRLDNFSEHIKDDGSIVKIEHIGLAVWTEHSKEGVNGYHAWFDHRDGNISVRYPDEEMLLAMISIAEDLNAKVLGDEGELYDEEHFGGYYPNNDGPERFLPKPYKPWWKFW